MPHSAPSRGLSQGYINHIVFVLDKSSSMRGLASALINVADSQITYLAQRSGEMDQETRVSVYTFADEVECVVYDKDVLRLPSIAKLYQPDGWTALIDGTMKGIEDLEKTSQLYGDHAFLVYVLTDGQENRSYLYNANQLKAKLKALPVNWTVAVLVPDQRGKFEAMHYGFQPDNIAIWDTSTQGVMEVGERIRAATDRFMTSRSSGVRGSTGIFSTGADAVNAATVAQAGMKPMQQSTYMLVPVHRDLPIKEFVESCGRRYVVGKAFYELTKREAIQPQKQVAVVNRVTNAVYLGDAARDLIGLPAMTVQVKPDHNPDFAVYVQSTSVNRKLVPGTKLLLLT